MAAFNVLRLLDVVAKVTAAKGEIQSAKKGDILPVGETDIGKAFGRSLALIIQVKVKQ